MLGWALAFLIIALIAGVLGFGGIAGASAGIAQFLFVVFVVLFIVAARGHVISTRRVMREAPWQIVVFSLGMYLVVYGLKNAGLTDLLTQLLDRLAALAARAGKFGAHAWLVHRGEIVTGGDIERYDVLLGPAE